MLEVLDLKGGPADSHQALGGVVAGVVGHTGRKVAAAAEGAPNGEHLGHEPEAARPAREPQILPAAGERHALHGGNHKERRPCRGPRSMGHASYVQIGDRAPDCWSQTWPLAQLLAQRQNDMCIDDVGGAARSKKPAHAPAALTLPRGRIGGRLADEAGEAHLAGRRPAEPASAVAGTRDAVLGLASPGQQDKDPAVVAFEGDEGAGVQGHARHQAVVADE